MVEKQLSLPEVIVVTASLTAIIHYMYIMSLPEKVILLVVLMGFASWILKTQGK